VEAVKLCVVAGEASGDLHGSELIRELSKLDPQLELFGFGGDRLAAQGMRVIHHARELGIVGLFNVLRHLPMFRKVFAELVEEIRRERPDAVLLIDYPDFNLRLARECRKMGVKVLYYISPQVWAWRRGRIREIAKNVDHMIVIFPFELSFYQAHGVPVTYVGHPLREQLGMLESPASLPPQGEPLRVALLPGSRRMEVSSLLPPMLEAVELIRQERPVDAFVVQAPTIDRALLERAAAGRLASVRVVPHDGGEELATAHLALSSSGTATLECAVIGVPVVVMYRLSPATYYLARLLVRLPHFSLVNIVAGRRVVPELIQHQVRGTRVAAAAKTLLQPAAYHDAKRELARVRNLLGESPSSARAAQQVWALMNE
jgi:lipid-A-disaccharide synthase